MTSEAHPPDDTGWTSGSTPTGSATATASTPAGAPTAAKAERCRGAPFRLERPAPVERTIPGPGRRNAGRLRGRVAGRGRPRMDAVGGLRGHQRHPLTGAETRGAARRISPG